MTTNEIDETPNLTELEEKRKAWIKVPKEVKRAMRNVEWEDEF